jgi:hypothetical protein
MVIWLMKEERVFAQKEENFLTSWMTISFSNTTAPSEDRKLECGKRNVKMINRNNKTKLATYNRYITSYRIACHNHM